MKKIIIAFIGILCALSSYAYTERNILASRASLDNLKQMLVQDQKWVTLPSYSDRAAWDALLGADKDKYITRGEKFLDYDWPRVRATAYLEYERSGNRKVMENPLDMNNIAMADLLMAELAEGKGRFLDQIIDGVYAAAEMSTWALSAHIPAYHKSPIQPYDKPVIELVSGDMGTLYSWVYYFLNKEFDKVNPEISRRLRHELKTRVLDPYLEYDSWWWDGSRKYSGRMLNNWTPWCLSNVLMTAMLMEDDPDRYAQIAYLTMLGTDKFLNYIKSDGACEEGPSYWGHAAGKTLDYVDMIRMATGGKIDIGNEPLIRNMGEYIARSYVGDGWVINFADASAKGSYEPFLIYRYGKTVGSDLLKDFAALTYRDGAIPNNGRDIFRTFSALSIADELRNHKGDYRRPAYTWYPETEFCYISTPEGLTLGCKGGFNDESHNHNDVGTFSVWADNYPLLIDAGVGTYTKFTFSDKRYTIWTMQSGWHNLPKINGFEQKYGRKYKASAVKASGNSFEADIAGAYPKEAGINKWTRSYSVKGRKVSISDKFDINNPTTPNEINFLSWGDIDISKPGKIAIDAAGHKAELTYNPSQFEASLTDQPLPDKRLSNVWGPKVTRITLKAKKTAPKGSYSFAFKAL